MKNINPRKIEGLRVLLSGGTKGLGRALVRLLLEKGARVATFARDEGEVAALRREFPELAAFQADVSRAEEIHRIAAVAFHSLGAVDLLVHNASSLGPTPLRPLLDTECEDFSAVLEANLLGPFRLSKAVLPSMLTGGGGLLVHISSDASVSAYPNWGVYSVSKAAVDHLSRLFAAELGEHGVESVAVDPGDLRTELHFAAVPGADPEKLKAPGLAARQLVERIESGDFGNGRVSL